MTERISEAEWQVMEVLWAAEGPMAAQDVAAGLASTGWTLATVKTLLSRLAVKGALASEAEGRRFLYRAAIARADVAGQDALKLVDRLFGGRATPLVAHMAERGALSADDIAELEALIAELKA
ncbi:MAG: BlaI/MecI/CopY family transcriptional regulator [Sphingomonadales bacterium]